ncbi:short-chain dehydrogenase [Vibrio sp. UCD-FRSSP16_10]|uniref:SDR family oxidoreductase n=1 Tax=unclassified Vibrio TaxID=2614977 RepID=UPI0007FDFB24|nr:MULTISPECIES: SDR family oxidoreductase [unclassified Vibrio]OBT15911.1 short-chain dehydrogenase [Vibrio sp. UCD-FRSSP16_10]OBT17805.1 short-chain dehydrogenase [Vibrio sp. UCD-FRSSP16_30]
MRTILITGANRGIGFGLTVHYLKKGAQVVATYRDESTSDPLFDLIQTYDNLHIRQLDVTDYAAVKRLANEFDQLDLLINNAGYYGPKGGSLGDIDVQEWRKVLEVNTIAPLKLVEAFYPALEKSNEKRIAILSSKVGSMTENTSGGGYIYRSSKAGVNSVIKSLHNDLNPQGFTVLALHPGWVKTEMGGPNALIEVNDSVKGLVNVIENSTTEQSGGFFNYDGQSIAW